MTLLIAVVLVTLSVSATCSLLEAGLYSTRMVTLEAAKAAGRHRRAADRLLRMKRDIATPTSAILILNTIANTAGATFAGMYAASMLGASWVPAFSAVLTLLILLFAEILPKTYGASKWKVLWPYTTWLLAVMVQVLSPLVWFTRKLTRLLTGTAAAPTVTEAEIRASIRLGGKAGELSKSEIRMLESVFHLDETTCGQIMVPRNEVHYFDVEQPASSLARVWEKARHTRYPVCRGQLETVIGIVHAKDLVGVPLSDRVELEALVRPAVHVPEMLSISHALREMKASHRQMLIVVDEYGGTTGLVTLKDIIEEIVGGLQDEHEQDVPDITVIPDGYAARGNVPLVKLNRELRLDLYDPTVVTLSGLMTNRMGRLLKPGDEVDLEGAVAKVMEVRANRAAVVHLVMPHRPEPLNRPSDDGAPAPSEEDR